MPVSFGQSRACMALVLLAFGAVTAADAATVRVSINGNACAALSDGRQLYLECQPPKGEAGAAFWSKYLAAPAEWTVYKDRTGVAVAYNKLNAPTQRAMLLALFPDDYVDKQGWWHVVTYAGGQGQESLWSIAEWITGKGTAYRHIMADKRNRAIGNVLSKGQQILVPFALLPEVMRKPAAKRARSEAAPPDATKTAKPVLNGDSPQEDQPMDLDAAGRELEYGSDGQGRYAAYRLKQGEALYTAVAVRFTDYRDNDALQDACRVIQQRSGIANVHEMQAGQRVLIPLEMLSDRFTPKDSESRKDYELTLAEAKRLRGERVQTRDLQGVVVIVDPGHGGRDKGAENTRYGVCEDAVNYDIACRVKQLLETKTRAKVYMTMRNTKKGYTPSNAKRLKHDGSAYVLTTPNYHNEDAKVSVNLRWYLANSIYRAEVKKGTDSRKIVFTSFHTDALFNNSLRGAMIYLPGAKYRRESEDHSGPAYTRYKEVRESPSADSTDAERRRDEALSRNFADDLMLALGNRHIRRHLEGDWIRSQIRQDGGKVYVPSVLRNTLVPTKVLIESANITNDTDCARVADPEWRQEFAQAYVDALKSYFGS